MANDSVGVAAAASPTNYIDNESIATGGSPANVDRQRVRLGGAGYTDLSDVVTGDTGQGALVSVGARKEAAFTTTTVQAVASTDVSNFRFAAVWIGAQGGGSSVTPQGSNDNSTWFSIPWWNSTSTAPSLSSGGTGGTGFILAIPLACRYFRLNVTGISSGTTSGTVEFFAVAPPSLVRVVQLVGGSSISISGWTNPADAQANASTFAIGPEGYNGSSWDRLRVPTIFKTATATASGDTALWTPTSGKKFRLLRFKIEATQEAATSGGGDIDVVLRDSTTATSAAMSFYAPSTSVTTTPGVISTGWLDLGNGIISAAANNVLNINLSAALSSGKVRVVACGTEE